MEFKVLNQKHVSYRNRETYYYSVLAITNTNKYVMFHYDFFEINDNDKRIANNEYLYPMSYEFIDKKQIDAMLKTYNTSYKMPLILCGRTYNLLSGTPEEHKLHIPEPYYFNNVKYLSKVDNHFSNDITARLKKLSLKKPMVVVGERVDELTVDDSDIGDMLLYYCPHCYNIFHENRKIMGGKITCPHCNYSVKRYGKKGENVIVMDNFQKHHMKEYNQNGSSDYNLSGYGTQSKTSLYYVARHSEYDEGIIIYKVNYIVSAVNNQVTEEFAIEGSIEHVVGKKMRAYKHLKSGLKETDPFKILSIHSKNIGKISNFLYDGFDNFNDFAYENEKFLKMSGFLSALKYSPITFDLETFFIIFICIVNKYPILEQIIKMGHARLFFNLYDEMIKSTSKDEILAHIEKINGIVNPESTGGKDILRFPIYIGEYLVQKNASLDEYFYWRDIYEISKLTKEQFYNLTESINYAIVNASIGMHDIGNVLKYGYNINSLLNYICKTTRKTGLKMKEIINMMSDYLDMCDLLQIEKDLYPQNLKKQHDELSVVYKERQKVKDDEKLRLIAESCQNYVVPKENELDNIGIPKAFKEFSVIFPKTELEFLDEGNQQHNCVGSYPKKVKKGETVVFFIRYKGDEKKSFITADCTERGLNQCYYSNAREVLNKDLLDFAEYISNKILTGVKSGIVYALKNVKKK